MSGKYLTTDGTGGRSRSRGRLFAEDGSPAIELRELRYFVAVADELHFTRAAARLSIAQQALSSAIRSLEARVGGELFERTTREVRLTAAGKALLPFARETLSAASRAVEATRAALDGVEGRIRLGVARAALAFGEPIERAMSERFPRVVLDRTTGFVPALVDSLRSGALDAVIGDCTPPDPALATQRIADQPAVVVVDSNHRFADSPSLRVEDLRDELLVLSPDDIARHWRSWVLGLFADARLRPNTVETSGFTRPTGTAAGETIAISSDTALDWLPPAADGLVRVPLDGVTMPFDLVWRATDSSPAIKNLCLVAARTAARLGWALLDRGQ
ncbi:MAG: LysR family transcriptional regulator [Solirubrobacterales bacterium]|nr:LysR family transcriptional regulator [Solirubrobacterales bacterium]